MLNSTIYFTYEKYRVTTTAYLVNNISKLNIIYYDRPFNETRRNNKQIGGKETRVTRYFM